MEEARRRKIARLQSRAEKYRQRRELRIKERVARVQEQQKKDQRIEALQSHDIMGVVGSHWSRNDEMSDVNNREHQAWQGIEMEIQGTSPGPLAIEAVDINDGADNRNASVRLHKRRSNTSRPSLLRQPSASLQKQRTTIFNIASKAKPSCGISNKRAILSSTRQLRAEYGIDDEPYDLSSKTTKKVQAEHPASEKAIVTGKGKNRKNLKGPSNRKKVCLALKNVCLAGAHLFDEHSDARNAIGASTSENFLVLMGKKEKLAYRGLYAINPATKEACLIHGVGPDMLNQHMVSGYFKYSTSTRSFAEIGGTRTFTSTTDAITLKPEFLKKRPRRKTQLNLDYRAKVMENMDKGRGMFNLR